MKMPHEKNSADYSPVSQHGIEIAPTVGFSSRFQIFRKRSWIFAIVGILIALISALVIAAIVINVQGAKQEKLQASCLPLGSQNNVYKLANSSNQFDLRLLDQITSTYDGNIILSSLSVVSVLLWFSWVPKVTQKKK